MFSLRQSLVAIALCLTTTHTCTSKAAELGKERLLLKRGPDIYALAFSPDSRILASGGDDQLVRLWDVSTGKLLYTLRGHSQSVQSLCFSPDGHTLASGGQDKKIRLWNAQTGRLKATLNAGRNDYDEVHALAFSPDGRTLVSGSSDGVGSRGRLRLWQSATGRILRTALVDEGVSSLDISRDGQRLLVASGSNDGEADIGGEWSLWNLAHLRVDYAESSDGVFYQARFSPRGDWFAIGGELTPLQLRRASDLRKSVATNTQQECFSLDVSPDGKRIACGDFDKKLTLRDTQLRRTAFKILGGYVRVVRFSPNGHTLAVADDTGFIHLFSVSVS